MVVGYHHFRKHPIYDLTLDMFSKRGRGEEVFFRPVLKDFRFPHFLGALYIWNQWFYVFDRLATESSKGSKIGNWKKSGMNEFFSFILVRREVTHPSLPCIGFQVDLHVGHQKPPKETPQEKMADVMAIAEVTKEETLETGETDRRPPR